MQVFSKTSHKIEKIIPKPASVSLVTLPGVESNGDIVLVLVFLGSLQFLWYVAKCNYCSKVGEGRTNQELTFQNSS